MPKETSEAKDKARPIHEIRMGRIKGTLWKNVTDSGVRFNATFARIYREGESWRTTESFGRDDLLLLAKVADQVHSWICTQGQEEEKAGPTEAVGS